MHSIAAVAVWHKAQKVKVTWKLQNEVMSIIEMFFEHLKTNPGKKSFVKFMLFNKFSS